MNVHAPPLTDDVEYTGGNVVAADGGREELSELVLGVRC